MKISHVKKPMLPCVVTMVIIGKILCIVVESQVAVMGEITPEAMVHRSKGSHTCSRAAFVNLICCYSDQYYLYYLPGIGTDLTKSIIHCQIV